jgi:RNA polymerase sigma-70 factor (ECF subfamily)
MKKILLNNCYHALRKERSLKIGHNAFPDDILIEESIEQQIDRSAGNRQIYGSLSSLSAELRSCVLLRYFSRFDSYEEIALILGIPVGTVRSRLAAAREKLCALYSHYNDETDKAFIEAKQWSDYYRQIWESFYEDPETRNEFFSSLNPALHVRFTSGKTATGKYLIEEEFNNDFIYGSRFNVQEVHSCGNISIIEGVNSNSPEYPDRCAPSSVIVLFRENGNMVNACNIFDSHRPR